jgi:thiol:disulfide interchange protein/DsbC/DsbD-like thiol-disulfide interchange protein
MSGDSGRNEDRIERANRCDERPLCRVKKRGLMPMMRSRGQILVFLWCLAALLPASAMNRITSEESSDTHAAADGAHLRVELVVPESSLGFGSARNDAGLYFKLEPGWHVYWSNAGDSGEPPHIKWTLPAGITARSLRFPAPKRLPLGPLMDFGYEDEVLFPFSFDIAKTVRPGPADLQAKVDWLVCREVCIPGKAELDLTRNVSAMPAGGGERIADAQLIDRFTAQIPKSLPARFKAVFQPTGTGFRLSITTGQRESTAAFFPEDQNILDNPAIQTLTPTADGLILALKKDANLTANPDHLRGVVELSGGRTFELDAAPGTVAGGSEPSGPAQAPSTSTAVSAPAGALSTSGPGANRDAQSGTLFQSAAFAFLGGLLLNLMPCVFPVLFIKGLALVQSGSEARHALRNHGLVYAAGIVVSFWVLVAVLLGLRAAGAHLGWGYQFQSPIFLSLMSALLFFLGLSLAGQFEIGLTLTSAGGSLAAKQGYLGSFFTGVLAVIVATPCTAPFMGGAIGYALAQSPAVTLAVFTALALGLASPYVALTLQPAWTRFLPRPGAWMEVLKQATAVPVFGTVIWLAWVLAQAYGATLLAALLASLLLLAVAGWFLGRWPARPWATSIAACLLTAVVLLSVVAPGKLAVVNARSSAAGTGAGWQPWSSEAVSRFEAAGRPVFVDFTASWCLSCQVNERVALGQPEVQKAFIDANVVLMRADWTQHDEAIGQVLAGLGRSGVPAYALYVPGQTQPRLLPEVLTPGIVTEALSKLPRATTQSARATSNLR